MKLSSPKAINWTLKQYGYREDHKVVPLFANKKNFFNNRGNLNLRCPGETSNTYLTIDQKFIGVVRTETEI
jgi:hypothetical protein